MKEKYMDMKYILECFREGNMEIPFEIEILDSTEGLQHIESSEWEELVWEFRSEFLLKNKGLVRTGIGKIWNENSAYFRKSIDPIIKEYLQRNFLPQTCIDSILFDLSTLRNYKLLQDDFGIESSFHDDLLLIYERGYIPVGYQGNYPEGHFKVMKMV